MKVGGTSLCFEAFSDFLSIPNNDDLFPMFLRHLRHSDVQTAVVFIDFQRFRGLGGVTLNENG